MPPKRINDTRLIRLIDEGKSQAEVARELGVSRQAVHTRLRELRGRVTQAVVAKKVEQVVDRKLDALEQLQKINAEANRLLDEIEASPEVKLRAMAEIRGQLRLQLEIFETLFSLQAAEEFQQEVLAAIGEVAPEVRNEIIARLNKRRAIRSALRFA